MIYFNQRIFLYFECLILITLPFFKRLILIGENAKRMPVVVWLTGLSGFLQGPICLSICGCDVIFLMRMLCTPAGMVCFPIQNIWAMEYVLNFCFCFDCSTSSKDLVVYRVCKIVSPTQPYLANLNKRI